jgi:hypothetical protein
MVEPPATCDGCMAKLLRSSFSPAQPLRHSFPPTRPTDCEQSISQRRALCPGEHRLYKWSFQASLLPSRNGTHVVPTAPVEGAPPAIFKSELVPRARSGSTGTTCVSFPPFWCARSASTGDQPARSPLRFWLCALGEQGRRITAIPASRGCSSYTFLRRRRESRRRRGFVSSQGGSRWTRPDAMC